MKTKVFQLIDFDRTLFDTTLLIECILDELEKNDPPLFLDLKGRGEEAYKEERTFLLLRYLREHKGDAWLEKLVEGIVAARKADDFMLPGANERLKAADELSGARPSWGILTYGDPIDQRLKLRLAGFENVPSHIVTAAEKGDLIASWALEDGTFQLPDDFGGGVVDTLTFEDDKLSVFQGTPGSLIGVWVTHRDDAIERLEEASLSNVVIARDLRESLSYLKKKLARL